MLLTVVNELLRHDEYRGKGGPLQTVAKASLCVVIFALVELLKTLGGRALSLRVHSKSLFSKLRVRAAATPFVAPHRARARLLCVAQGGGARCRARSRRSRCCTSS